MVGEAQLIQLQSNGVPYHVLHGVVGVVAVTGMYVVICKHFNRSCRLLVLRFEYLQIVPEANRQRNRIQGFLMTIEHIGGDIATSPFFHMGMQPPF